MPQLILHPWFIIFLMTWLSLLIFSPKILSYNFLNAPVSSTLTYQTHAWSWPWQ